MTKYYKLTDTSNRTIKTQWGIGVIHKAKGTGKEICSSDVIHVYDHPLKAVMFNPIHANFLTYHLWEVRVKKVVANDTLKVGVKQCTTLRQIDAPVITTEQRVKFAILCALEVYSEKSFALWANDWLSGKNRSESAVESVRSAAESAGSAAWSAAWSAMSAVRSAAESAGSAAWSAAESAKPIDFVALIKQARK